MKDKFVTIEHARGKLKERGENMTDEEIEKLLYLLRVMCNKVIDSVIYES